MHDNAPTAQQLRYMWPDMALHADKQYLLMKLRPLRLEFSPYDSDDTLTISLHNGYRMVLTAAETSDDTFTAWVFPVPTTTFAGKNLEETMALYLAGKPSHRTTEVPVYTAFVRLEHQWDDEHLPSMHHLVQSPDPVQLVEDALVWCRHETGLPLLWKHLGSEVRA